VLTLSLVVRKVSLIAISPNVRRLLIKVLTVFEAFHQTAYEIFYAPTCKTDCLQILYKFCKNWISVPNIVHQLKQSLRCKYCKIHSCSLFPNVINSIGPTLLGRNLATASQWRQSSMTSFVLSRRVRGIKIKKRGLIFHVFRQALP